MLVAEMPFYERVKLGKAGEQAIADRLRECGLDLRDVSEEVDMNDKIDRYLWVNGVRYTCQIKFREGSDQYRDFLLDLFEPYFGDGNPNTKIGRDYLSNYDVYVCRIRETIYVINGETLKKVVDETLKGWRAKECPSFYASEKYPGVEIRITTDRKNNRRKVLMFVPPNTFGPGEMRRYPA